MYGIPTGASSGSNRVKRGGSWNNPAGNVRSANRNNNTPSNRNNNLGFRLVRPSLLMRRFHQQTGASGETRLSKALFPEHPVTLADFLREGVPKAARRVSGSFWLLSRTAQTKRSRIFMKIQYAAFLLPLYADSVEQEALNRFIRTRRIVQTRKELVSQEGQSWWAILVEYLDTPAPVAVGGETPKSKVDYKELLSPEDFAIFSQLREARKKLSEENGLPVYAVCTNEQLAEIARQKPKTVAECKKIEGIGQGKAEKYVPAFIEIITAVPHEDTPAAF
ncbi:MAG: HRDC domain-containing protein [Treponema sp.]|nr:HRDC domain-containing protein [Treponema sp.]